MLTQNLRHQVQTVLPSANVPDTQCSHLREELDLLQQMQHLVEEERAHLQYHPPLASASENCITLKAKDKQISQQQRQLLQTADDAMFTTQELQNGLRTLPTLLDTSQRAPAAEERVQESNNISPLNRTPSPDVSEAVCLMVEDPYFDTPMSSPSSEETPMDSNEDTKQWALSPVFEAPSLCLNDQTLELTSAVSGKLSVSVWDTTQTICYLSIYAFIDVHFIDNVEANTEEESPPPLPERTPESYVLAVDTG